MKNVFRELSHKVNRNRDIDVFLDVCRRMSMEKKKNEMFYNVGGEIENVFVKKMQKKC